MCESGMGKILPNLKVTVGKDNSDSEASLEDGEISDPELITKNTQLSKHEIVRKWMQTLQTPKVYPNKLGGFETGLDLSSEGLIKKLEDRAERFGLDKREQSQITQLEIDALYKSLGLDPENLKSSSKNFRLDVIHMRGVSDMNTKQVLDYFKDYGPSSVEWINDVSCNVCWLDDTSAARALLGMSERFLIKRKRKNQLESKAAAEDSDCDDSPKDKEAVIEVSDSEEDEIKESSSDESKSSDMEDDKDSDTGDDKDSNLKADADMDIDEKTNKSASSDDAKNASLDVPVPPGHWRLGIPHPKAKAILLRFATKDDRKLPGAEKRSQYYQKYGNPNYGGLKGLISTSRKRKFQAVRNRQVIEKLSGDNETAPRYDSRFTPDYQRRSKVPRMKMYADEEEEKIKNRGYEKPGNFVKPRSVKSRLGTRYTSEELQKLGRKYSCDEEEESDDEPLSVTCKIPSRFNIWNEQAKAMAEEENISMSHSSDRYSPFVSERAADGYTPFRSERASDRYTPFRSERVSDRYTPFVSERDSYNSARSYQPTGDLRDTLNSSSRRSGAPKADLRSKIQKLKKEDNPRKHRSPLCIDSD